VITKRGMQLALRNHWKSKGVTQMEANRKILFSIKYSDLTRILSHHRVVNLIWIWITKTQLILLLSKKQGRLLRQRCLGLWSLLRLCNSQILTLIWAQLGNSKSFNQNSHYLIRDRAHQGSGQLQRAQHKKGNDFRQLQIRNIISTTFLMCPRCIIRIICSTFRLTLELPSITTPHQTAIVVEPIRKRKKASILLWLRIVRLRGHPQSARQILKLEPSTQISWKVKAIVGYQPYQAKNLNWLMQKLDILSFLTPLQTSCICKDLFILQYLVVKLSEDKVLVTSSYNLRSKITLQLLQLLWRDQWLPHLLTIIKRNLQAWLARMASVKQT